MTQWLAGYQDLFNALTSLVVLFGVPVGLYQYVVAVRKEQRDREHGTYNALDEKYLDFQSFCFENPQLDIFDVPDSEPAVLTAHDEKKELIGFTMLMSIFERAFLMYSGQSDTIRQRQWQGWRTYIETFAARDNFRKAWKVSGTTFDTTFEEFMNRIMSAPGAARSSR